MIVELEDIPAGDEPLPPPTDAPAAAGEGGADALAEHLGRWLARWSRELGADDAAARTVGRAGEALARATREGHVCIGLAELAAALGGLGAGALAEALRASRVVRVLDAAAPAARPAQTPAGTAFAAPSDGPAAAPEALPLADGHARGAPEAGAPDALPRPGTEADARTEADGPGSATAGGAPNAMPLVLDAGGRLYLQRDFNDERRLAGRLAAALRAPPYEPGEAAIRQLRERFAANAARLGDAPDWQQAAAALALRGRLAVVSGGPGTGKTTMVVNLIAALLAEQPEARIALAAPTGKAAARMAEALRGRAAGLPPELRERLPTQAATVHRLLGVTRGGFRHDAEHPLPIDALIVDEASMLDLALARKLVEAVPPHARLVLLGDKDQLAAVEAGAVFAELSADPTLTPATQQAIAALCGVPAERLRPPPPASPSALRDAAVWFTQNFRFAADSAIGRLAREINAGDAEAVRRRLARASDAARQASLFGNDGAPAGPSPDDDDETGTDGALRWISDAGAQPSAATLAAAFDGFAAYAQALRHAPHDVAGATAAFERFRVLCALREGPRGLVALNEQLSRRLRPAEAPPGPWYAGRPVMVLRNDPLRHLFNGDVGLVLPDAAGALQVWFPDATAPGGFRAVHPARLPPHETAYAMTVHKSQGSEFDAVLLVMPAGAHRVVTRELLYTAVTRAKSRVTIAGGAEGVVAAVGARTRRDSGLLERLAEALRVGN